MNYSDFLKRTVFYSALFILAVGLASYHLHQDWLEALGFVLVIPIIFSFLFFFETGGIISGFLASTVFLVFSILYRTEFTDIPSYYISLALPVLIYVFLGLGGGRIASFVKDVSVELEQQRLLSTFTGLYTKEYLINLIQRHINEYERYNIPFSIILLEVTRDTLQALKATRREDVLIKIGLNLREDIRMIDEIARYDNQYLLVLPHTPLSGSQVVDKRIKKTIGKILDENNCLVADSEATYSITIAYPENNKEMEKLLDSIRSSMQISAS